MVQCVYAWRVLELSAEHMYVCVCHWLVDSSVVKFEPTSFIDPFLFAENKTFPSKTQVKEYIDVLQGKSTKRIFRVRRMHVQSRYYNIPAILTKYHQAGRIYSYIV